MVRGSGNHLAKSATSTNATEKIPRQITTTAKAVSFSKISLIRRRTAIFPRIANTARLCSRSSNPLDTQSQAQTNVAKMAGEIPSNSDAALAKRHKQSAIVGKLLVACFGAIRSGYARKHPGAVFEELLVAMMIRMSDDLGAPPRTASD